MKYTIFKLVKIKFSGEESIVLITNDKTFADESLQTYLRQSLDDEYYKLIED